MIFLVQPKFLIYTFQSNFPTSRRLSPHPTHVKIKTVLPSRKEKKKGTKNNNTNLAQKQTNKQKNTNSKYT